MKFFSHKQEKHELKTELDEALSIEDILAEYQAEQSLETHYDPIPDGHGEYYSSSQGGAEEYYDSESYTPEDHYSTAPETDWEYYSAQRDTGTDLDDIFDSIFARYYDEPDSTNPNSNDASPQTGDEDVRVYSPPSYDASDRGSYAPRGGNIGATEREAWEYIAQVQQQSAAEYQPQFQAPAPAAPSEETGAGSAENEMPDTMPEEVDSRFNLGGQKVQNGYYFGDRAIDMSADKDYVPAPQTDYKLSHWAPEAEDGADGDDEDTVSPRRKSFFKKRKKEKAGEGYSSDYETQSPEEDDGTYSQGFRDHKAAPSDYALDDDYDVSPGLDRRSRLDEPLEDDDGLPSFREYVASLFATAFLRIRGTSRGITTGTMNDSEEDLGPELTPASACRYYGSFIRSQRLRLRIALGLLILLCYISLGLPVPGMLQHIPVTAAACCAIQLAIMLLALDIVTTGVLNAARLRVGADSLAVLSCLLTTIDGFIVALSDSAAVHIPLCAVSSLSLVGLMLSSSLCTRGIRKAFRVPAIGRRFYSVTGETKLRKDELTLLKSLRSAKGFVRRTEEAAPDETLFVKLGPVLMAFTLLLSLVISLVKKNFSDFVYIFSAVFALAVPFGALLAFALPYFAGSMRIFKSGAAVAGWSGLCDIGVSRNLIVTDRDLFPESSVEMDAVRIFADESTEKVISYAGTLVSASGASMGSCFVKLMEENHCTMRQVENFEYLSGGGLKGIIEGHVVLCGSMELMRLMNIRIPYRLTDKTSVLLAIDGVLYGIFTLKYTPLPQVRRALVELVRSGRHPVFAIRDFNVNPEMLHTTFDIATDGYDFPPYVERFAMSEASAQDSKIAAVICNEGLGPLTEVADVGRSMYLSTRINLVITALSAILGPILVFVKLLTAGSVSIGFLLLFMLAWALPSVITSLYVSTKS